jgi:hypothetical protein
MKVKPVKEQKLSREPRLDCTQRIYSQAALDMLEQATGTRYAKLTPSPAKAPVAATDSD